MAKKQETLKTEIQTIYLGLDQPIDEVDLNNTKAIARISLASSDQILQ